MKSCAFECKMDGKTGVQWFSPVIVQNMIVDHHYHDDDHEPSQLNTFTDNNFSFLFCSFTKWQKVNYCFYLKFELFAVGAEIIYLLL